MAGSGRVFILDLVYYFGFPDFWEDEVGGGGRTSRSRELLCRADLHLRLWSGRGDVDEACSVRRNTRSAMWLPTPSRKRGQDIQIIICRNLYPPKFRRSEEVLKSGVKEAWTERGAWGAVEESMDGEFIYSPRGATNKNTGKCGSCLRWRGKCSCMRCMGDDVSQVGGIFERRSGKDM